MKKTEFLTIYPTFENLEVVKKVLPSIIEETKRNDAALIVHDSSVKGREEKWEYLQKLNKDNDFFLLLSDNLSMAHARNMCLALGQEMFIPDYICMLEDDHGFNEGLIESLVLAMKNYYGKESPNRLKYGMFSCCTEHTRAKINKLDEKYSYPDGGNNTFKLGGFNSCFRCAPTSHWNNVLKGYDTDEYLISRYQTANLRLRNYNKGFTILFIDNGDKIFTVVNSGRGETSGNNLKLWDDNYTASDPRSKYIGKKN